MGASRIVWELVALFGVVTLVLLHLYTQYSSRLDSSQVVITTTTEHNGGNDGVEVQPSVTIQRNRDPDGPAVQKMPPLRKVEKANSSSAKIASRLNERGLDWAEFVASSHDESFRKIVGSAPKQTWVFSEPPVVCAPAMVRALAEPLLKRKDLEFCKWALDPNGGRVVVGKSWGSLRSSEEKWRFDALNCNAVGAGANPSCADSWGDEVIRSWRQPASALPAITCDASRPSQVSCLANANKDLSCTITNAMLDFSKVRKVGRSAGMTPSKIFEQDFLSADCRAEHDGTAAQAFPFPHLFSSKRARDRCDVIYNGTLLVYSHDDIRNVGHTMNDIMNVWVMLWMERVARYGRHIDMLNVDSFKLGHNFDDQPNRFFHSYIKSLRSILKGADLAGKTLCVKKLLLQPTPPRFFVWESWFVDLPCSFVGPSTLYQRWNLHVRQAYSLLAQPTLPRAGKGLVVLVVRNEHSNMWGSQRTSRNFLNLDAIQAGLQQLLGRAALSAHFELRVQDLAQLNFRQQIELMVRSSLVIGMHGAGIAMTMHMSIGSEKCCGVLELYPEGEFVRIRGHGNMARKMGLHYDRVDIDAQGSRHDGAHVPVDRLVVKTEEMLTKMLTQPTCVHPDVIADPFLEN